MVTLEELLESRDRRVAHQRELLEMFPGCSLVCLTVQLPGPVKRTADSLVIGGAGLGALLGRFGSVTRHSHVRDLPTGYEAYLVLPLAPVPVKKICCEIEDTHPLGRLMDIDVLSLGEDGAVPLSRQDVGLQARRCLLCDKPARECMRSRSHSTEELLSRIKQMVSSYTDTPL